MNLYMKQKVFSWRAKFSITDENGEPQYYAQGELISLGRNLHIYDANMNEVAEVRQKLTSLISLYRIFVGMMDLGEIKIKTSFLKAKYELTGLGWIITSTTFQRSHTITDKNGKVIGAMHKKLMSWGDCYEIEVEDPENTLAVVAVVVAINAIHCDEREENNLSYDDD